MGSKSSIFTTTDASGISASAEGSTALRFGEGTNSTVNYTPTDFGAVDSAFGYGQNAMLGALNYSSDATDKILGTIGKWVGGATSLASAGIASSDKAAQTLQSAYANDRGNINWTSVLIVVAIAVTVVAGVAYAGSHQ